MSDAISPLSDAISPLMEQARAALERGDQTTARSLLRRAVADDPLNHRAWLWLAGITEAPAASLHYVRRAEALAPDDPTVQRALVWAEERLQTAAAAVTVVAAQPNPAAPAARQPEPSRFGRLLRLLGFGALALLAIGFLIGVLREAAAARAAGAAVAETAARNGSVAALVFTPEAPTAESAEATATPEPTAPPTRTPAPPTLAPTEPPATAEPPGPLGGHSRLRPKPAVPGADPIPAWTPTPTPTPLPTPTPAPIGSDPDAALFNEPRWISVNLTNQTLTAYENGQVVYRTSVSSGLSRTPTVTGQFRIYLRLEKQDMNGYQLGFNYYIRDVPYVMYFYGNYALHGAYWHNNFGQPMSHGCVNLSVPDSRWLFSFASLGTLVYVHY